MEPAPESGESGSCLRGDDGVAEGSEPVHARGSVAGFGTSNWDAATRRRESPPPRLALSDGFDCPLSESPADGVGHITFVGPGNPLDEAGASDADAGAVIADVPPIRKPFGAWLECDPGAVGEGGRDGDESVGVDPQVVGSVHPRGTFIIHSTKVGFSFAFGDSEESVPPLGLSDLPFGWNGRGEPGVGGEEFGPSVALAGAGGPRLREATWFASWTPWSTARGA